MKNFVSKGKKINYLVLGEGKKLNMEEWSFNLNMMFTADKNTFWDG